MNDSLSTMLSNTHHFLPIRNGLVPNTAHVMLHLATAATLFILLARWVDAAADPETSALSRPRLAVRFCGYHTPALFGDGPVLLSANHQNADWGTR